MGSDKTARLIARASAVKTELKWGMRLAIEVLCLKSTAAIEVFLASLEASVAKIVQERDEDIQRCQEWTIAVSGSEVP